MPAINFFCPCCGCKPVYSPELSREILAIVTEYYHLPAEALYKNWMNYDKGEGRARGFVLYFIRHITGENFKLIGEVFNLSDTRAGNMAQRIEKAIEEKQSYRIQAEAIELRILRSAKICNLINPKKEPCPTTVIYHLEK